jgi:two-component system response regulator RegA
MQIAIIDDDLAFRQVLARSLAKLGHATAHYAHPKELLDSGQVPSLILLDLQLECDTGLLWIKPLRDSFSNSKLILLTGYASIATAVEAIKSGADDYLTKPCTAREILNHLESDIEPARGSAETDQVMSVNRLEWEHIQRVLKDNDGNISAAARALGMHRRTLQRKLQKKPAKN